MTGEHAHLSLARLCATETAYDVPGVDRVATEIEIEVLAAQNPAGCQSSPMKVIHIST